MSLLGLHAGASGVTTVVLDEPGAVRAVAHRPVDVRAPRPGHAELATDELWRAVLAATGAVLTEVDPGALRGLGVSGTAGSVVLWDRETLGSPRPAITDADRRAGSALGDRLAWLAEHEPRTWALVESGAYAVGPLASYLLARLTRGTWHAVDAGHAARTGLLDAGTGRWSAERCAAAGVPVDALPELVPGAGVLDRTDARSFCDLDLPIAALAPEDVAAAVGRAGAGDVDDRADDRAGVPADELAAARGVALLARSALGDG